MSNHPKSLSIIEFKHVFNPTFSSFLRTKINEVKLYTQDPVLHAALEQTYLMFAERGKRIRPYAAYLMHKTATGLDDDEVLKLGMGLELLHAFALVQDDLIDNGEARHGVTTIHECIAQELRSRGVEANVDHLARSQAMLVSDLIYAWSHAVIGDIKSPCKDRLLVQLQEMMVKVIAGEMIDVGMPIRQVVSNQELVERDALKTASYTFEYPLLMGATLAGHEDEYMAFCHEFGREMGVVYQIQDDLLDIIDEESEHSDIREHQHTYLTQYVFAHGSKANRKELEVFFSGATVDAMNEARVLALVSAPEVIEATKAELRTRLKSAKQIIRDVSFADEYKSEWLNVVGLFERRLK